MNYEYPNVSKFYMWNNLRTQRVTVINFWNILKSHALSTIPFNSYIFHRFDIVTKF